MSGRYSFFIGLLVLGLALPFAAVAQAPALAVEAAAFRATERTAQAARVDLYVRVPYPRLQFLNQGTRFAARYDLTAEVFATDRRGRARDIVESQTWAHTALAPTFDAAQSDTLAHVTSNTLQLAPGAYHVRVRVVDRNTGEAYEYEEPLTVRAFYKPVAISDLLLLDAYDARTQTITPNVRSEVSPEEGVLTVFYELYAQVNRNVRVLYEVHRAEPKRSGGLRSLLPFGRQEEAPEPLLAGTVLEARPLRIGRSPQTLSIPLATLDIGEYVLRVRLMDGSSQEIEVVEQAFATRWSGLDQQLLDLNTAVAQLRYVAKPDEIRRIQQGRTPQEQWARFQAFWAKRDLTPGTDRNESMERYYYRVAAASRRYGWQSDQGEIFIKFGAPDRVERMRDGKQVREVWHYLRLRQQVVFLDRAGNGQFKLYGTDGKRFR